MRTVRYELLRPDELAAERDRCPVVYVPFGPIEWHAPQSGMGLDALNAEHIARASADRFGGVTLPTLFVGTEAVRDEKALRDLGFTDPLPAVTGMDFPGNRMKSLYYREEVLTVLLRDTARVLLENGYKLVVFINAHGATNQMHVLETLQREYDVTLCGTGKKVLFASPFAVADPSLGGGHATAGETSLLMYQHPESVDLSVLPPLPEVLRVPEYGMADGEYFMGKGDRETFAVLDDPRTKASRERGKADSEAEIAYLHTLVVKELQALGI